MHARCIVLGNYNIVIFTIAQIYHISYLSTLITAYIKLYEYFHFFFSQDESASIIVVISVMFCWDKY